MLVGLIITVSFFMILFVVAQIIKNNSIVDIGWGIGFVISSWSVYFILGEFSISNMIVLLLVSLWGVRLFYHIAKRNIGKPEDFRYLNWRKAWGKYVVPRAFLQVFLLQATLQVLIALPIFYFIENGLTLTMFSYIGIVLFFVGYLFQVVGDLQLKRHIAKKSGTLLTTGLWGVTRHPNYFGESLMWVSIFLVVYLSKGSIFLVISPIVITSVLRFISIPLLEKSMSRKEGWDEYAQKVSIFYPLGLKK
jgi:steroid 5-alpha reductase family enzyme